MILNLQPLINATSQTVAAVAPSPDAANAITAAFLRKQVPHFIRCSPLERHFF